ncbi:MAG: hypothetical protein ACRDTH_20780 [Pseudonocardiaceae bacterium]
MITVWVVVLVGLLLLFPGVLMGSSWTDQALDQQYRRLAIERRELDECHRELHENGCHEGCCIGCDQSEVVNLPEIAQEPVAESTQLACGEFGPR